MNQRFTKNLTITQVALALVVFAVIGISLSMIGIANHAWAGRKILFYIITLLALSFLAGGTFFLFRKQLFV